MTQPVTALPAHLGWRLLAMLYDSLPVAALWLLASAGVLALRGGEPVPPWSGAFWMQNLVLWSLTGAYVVESWYRGGQTLGMRPWRLQVVDEDGRTAPRSRLWQRYAWASLGLLAGGLGLWWSLLDSERRTLHDHASRTRLVRRSPA